jgi:hypothetical protein
MANKKVEAAEAYVKALRTGDGSAAVRAAKFLAPDVVLSTGQTEFKGYDAVLQRITGQWPNTPIYQYGGWTDPRPDGDRLTVHADFPPMGGGVLAIDLAFGFNGADQITRVDQKLTTAARPEPTDTIPDFVRGIVNTALYNGTPMCIAYTDESGAPILSLRGSTTVYSDHQLGIWVRNAEGGMVNSLKKNPKMSLLYRDSRNRTTLIFQGNGHIERDEATRNRLYEMVPEVEQNHDPDRKGAALIIDITNMQGNTPRGGVRVQRSS